METLKKFTGNTEQELWQQVAADMQQEQDFLNYTAILSLNGQEVLLDIDIDLGGGFESGFSTTLMQAKLNPAVRLRFNIHEQDLMNEVGKIFGMEDIKLGYPEFDDAFIIQTNQPETVKALFADDATRNILLRHPDARLKLSSDHDHTATYLQFSKDDAIVDVAELREIYNLMVYLLPKLA